MKNLWAMIFLLFLVSCGSQSGSGDSSSQTSSPVKVELSGVEKDFLKSLIEARQMPQKEFLKRLLRFETLSQKSFQAMDQFINLNCSEAQGLCEFSAKENL